MTESKGIELQTGVMLAHSGLAFPALPATPPFTVQKAPDLEQMLKDYREGVRGMPTYAELRLVADHIANLEARLKGTR